MKKPEVTFQRDAYVAAPDNVREALNEHCALEGRDENLICLDALTELVACTELEPEVETFLQQVIEQVDQECMITFHRPIPEL